MQYRTVRAAVHCGYFRPSGSSLTAAGLQHRYRAEQHTGMLCPLSDILLGRGEERKASECSAFVEQQAAMSAALSAASEPLASLAGAERQRHTNPKTPAHLEHWHSRAPAAGAQEAPQGLSPVLEPPSPTCSSRPTPGSGTAGSGPATARHRPRHQCQNHPTKGPVSPAPAPAQHIPRC